VGTLPPAAQRNFRVGGFAVPKDLSRIDDRASWAEMIALLSPMHAAAIFNFAGTDGSDIEIVCEIEIYPQAGVTSTEALAPATLVPARRAGAAKR